MLLTSLQPLKVMFTESRLSSVLFKGLFELDKFKCSHKPVDRLHRCSFVLPRSPAFHFPISVILLFFDFLYFLSG